MSTPTARARASSPAQAAKEKDATVGEKDAKKASGLPVSPKTAGIVVGLAVLGFVLKTYVFANVDLKQVAENGVVFIESQGNAAMYWYLALTLVGVVCLVPTTPMEVAGGFLFSPSWGMWTVLAMTGSTKLVANLISVLIARFLLKDWVMKNIVSKYELLSMVSKAVKDEPWKMCFLVRGSMVPLSVKNYGLGVMEVDYLPIAVCSSIFTNFYAFQNIYMGSTLSNLKEVFAPKEASDGPTDYTAMAKKIMPIVFQVLLIVLVVKAVKSQIKSQKAQIEANLKKGEKAETDKTK